MKINATCHAALDLFNAGFCPIPIEPETKKPARYWDRWRKGLDAVKIRQHFTDHPDDWLGVLTETGLLVLDADTPEGVVAINQLREDLDLEPKIIVSTTRGEHHYYRLGEGVFAKSHTPKKDEHPERFDIKSGRAMVVKPPSGDREYERFDIEHADDLQALSQDTVDALFRCNGAPPPRPHEQRPAQEAPGADATSIVSEEVAAPAAFIEALPRVRALLASIDPDCGYQDWFRVCAALHSESNGAADGFELFDDWSAKGSKYSGKEETAQQWHYCERYSGRRVTLASIAYIARQHGADINAIAREYPDHPGSTPASITESSTDGTTTDADSNTAPSTPGAGEEIPLSRFSLRGDSAAMRARLKDHQFLIEGIASIGEVTLWFAPPNVGKTLFANHGIIDAIEAGRVVANNVYYVNCDDSLRGLTDKVALAEQHGFHMLAPGHRKFRAEMLVPMLRTMTAKDLAHDIVVVLDTLKKITSVMDKAAARDFGAAVREFSTKGGTVLALAHTNKNRADDGKLVPAGTSDFSEDPDCTFIIDTLKEEGSTRTVRFERGKARGPADEAAAFTYSIKSVSSYADLLETVERVSETDLASIDAETAVQVAHPAELVDSIIEAIQRGYSAKQQIVEQVARSTSYGQRTVRSTLDAFEGTDSVKHRWTATKGDRGLLTYTVLASETAPDSSTAADPATSVAEDTGADVDPTDDPEAY